MLLQHVAPRHHQDCHGSIDHYLCRNVYNQFLRICCSNLVLQIFTPTSFCINFLENLLSLYSYRELANVILRRQSSLSVLHMKYLNFLPTLCDHILQSNLLNIPYIFFAGVLILFSIILYSCLLFAKLAFQFSDIGKYNNYRGFLTLFRLSGARSCYQVS